MPHYGQAEIDADDDAAAIAAACKAHAEGPLNLYDADWDNAVCKRIVHIEDQDGRIIAEDIAIDSHYQLLEALENLVKAIAFADINDPGISTDEALKAIQNARRAQ